MSRGRAGAHQADPPDFADQSAKTGADFQVEIVKQATAGLWFVDAVGHPNGCQGWQMVLLVNQQIKAHGFKTSTQSVTI